MSAYARSLAERFQRFTVEDGVSGPNGYVLALEAVLEKCAELRHRGGAQYPDEIAEEFEGIFAQFFGISR